MKGIEVYDTSKAFGIPYWTTENTNVFCPFHEHEETSKTPSCSVSSTGLFNCKVCGARGTALTFYMRRTGKTREEAHADLVTDSTKLKLPTRQYTPKDKHLPEGIVDRTHNLLLKDKQALAYLIQTRGINMESINTFQLGRDEYRLTIPVFGDAGNLVNIRRYLPHASNAPKMVSHAKGDATPVLYPIWITKGLAAGSELVVCEGEWDCIVANQLGFATITNTGNCTTWSYDWTVRLRGYAIRLVYDVNDKLADLGQRMAHKRAFDFYAAGCKDIKVIRLPLEEEGGDITDFFVKHHHTPAQFKRLIKTTASWTPESIPSFDTESLGSI